MHYTTALNASKKENNTSYQFEIFYACAVIVTSQFAKTTLLAWHYLWQKEIGSDTFWTDLLQVGTDRLAKMIPHNYPIIFCKAFTTNEQAC